MKKNMVAQLFITARWLYFTILNLPIDVELNKPILTHEETSPTVLSLLDRVYTRMIDLNELLNILEWVRFADYMRRNNIDARVCYKRRNT
jgi:hypothetical protein